MSSQAPYTMDPIMAKITKSIILLFGLLIVTLAVKAAINQKTEEYSTTPDVVASIPARDIQRQLTCLTRNIYWEAASEPFEGKVAVAQVTINRMNSGKFPDTVCGVVNQKTEIYNKIVCQFSWLCETTYRTKPVYQALYKESEEVAKMVMIEGFRLKGLQNALYYHADYVNPRWNKEKITQIGRHIFYKDRA